MGLKPKTRITYIVLCLFFCAGVFFIVIPVFFSRTNLFILRELTRTDPLFADSGINGDALRTAVGKVEAEEEKVRNIIPIPEDFHLYPYDFMYSLAVAKAASDRFVADPSKKNGETLISALEKSSELYSAWVRKKTGYLDLVVSASQWPIDQPIVFVNKKATSLKTVRDDFELALKNADAVKKELEKRSCLSGPASVSCLIRRSGLFARALRLKFAGVFSLEESVPTVSDEDALPLDILFPGIDRFITNVSGPYGVKTACFSDSSEPHTEKIIVADIEERGKEPYRLPKIMTDVFYIERGDALLGVSSAFFQFLSDRGWDMYYQPETLDYVCSDMTYVLEALSYAHGGSGHDFRGVPDALGLIFCPVLVRIFKRTPKVPFAFLSSDRPFFIRAEFFQSYACNLEDCGTAETHRQNHSPCTL